jgi:hypothetical protein
VLDQIGRRLGDDERDAARVGVTQSRRARQLAGQTARFADAAGVADLEATIDHFHRAIMIFVPSPGRD